MRRPKPKEALERRRRALALQRLPSRLFEGEDGGAGGKSISNKQDACDGMANRVSALMFQTLGELVVCLAVLRSTMQPLHKEQQTLGNKKTCSPACRFTLSEYPKPRDASISQSALFAPG